MSAPPGWTNRLLYGYAELLAAAGSWSWRPDGPAYTAGEIAVAVGALPQTPAAGVALQTYGLGADDPEQPDGELGLQIMMRAESLTAVNDMGDVVFGVLQGAQHAISGAVLLSTRQVLAPLGKDDMGRWLRADSYHLMTHQPTTHRP